MTKKFRDTDGNFSVKKKPFYKRIWFIVLAGLFVIGGLGKLVGVDKETTNTASSSIVESSQSSSASSTEVSTSEASSSSEATPATDFVPTDSTDATIESIETYNDYLEMYEFIVNEYVTNYENMVSQHGLGDDATYQAMRDSVTQSIDEQKKQYGLFGNAPIVGKDEIVQFLKEYRDSLQQQINDMSAALGG
ncbi:TPA: hypothetical protein ACGO3A_000016 [Streptococcus suis]